MQRYHFMLLWILLITSACQPAAAKPALDLQPTQEAAFNQSPDRPATQLPSPTIPTLPPTLTLSPSHPSLTPTSLPSTSSPTVAPTKPSITRLLFTGVIVPARCVQAKLDELGDADYPYQEVKEIISGADIAGALLTQR